MARRERIHFRCWYCNRKLAANADQVGEQRVCNCGQRYRVPRRNGIAKRDKTILDRIIESVVYGFGGGFFGLLIGFILFRIASGPLGRGYSSLMLIIVPVVVGFLVGGLFGELGINWIGSLLRNMVDDDHH